MDSCAGNAPMSIPNISLSSCSCERGRSSGGRRERALARVGPYQECAAAARGIEHLVVRAAYAEGVNEVHHVRRRVELAEPPALAGTDKPLVHLADHVEVQTGEVELFDTLNQARPVIWRC